MSKNRSTRLKGFTLAELMVATVLSSIAILSVGIAVVDSQRSWSETYNHTYSSVVIDAQVARRTFDSLVRKATGTRFLLGEDASWLEVYYCADANSTVVDRYGRFYEADGQLNIEYGRLDPRETLNIQTICENVQVCVFKAAGLSAQMILTLDNGSQAATVVSSAVVQNQ